MARIEDSCLKRVPFLIDKSVNSFPALVIHDLQRKRADPDPDPITYREDLDKALKSCDKEEGSGVEQPLYIDESTESIKCWWCPSWTGTIKVKVVNQHVRKAKSHLNARAAELNSSLQVNQTGVRQMNLFDFISIDH